MKVVWDEKKCANSGKCTEALPKVFFMDGDQFVIKPEAASEGEVRKAVKACPSGALKVIE
ncbi:MAG: (4Fe-4S)-binding protein [Burkholderiales bacterium]